MKVLLTGAGGQLGKALQRCVPPGITLVSSTRQQLDLANPAACRDWVFANRPDWVLNAGAYTAVDRAEQEPALAEAVNALAPAAFAEALAQTGGRMLQISTDFVFDGTQRMPYRPDQNINPLGVYGRTKACGEKSVLSILGNNGRGHVLRTSWVYGPVGKNFCRTILHLHRKRSADSEPLAVVADQIGCPTSTINLARACWSIICISEVPDIMHWTDLGAISWYDFAFAIGEIGVEIGLLREKAQMLPLITKDYPTLAIRPAYSVLDCTLTTQVLGIDQSYWRSSVIEVLTKILTMASNPA